jgi:O-acetyl-ADP-ribose deacetylase (regulator of RNase III)
MLEIQKGDITRLAVDAIVNAANETLLGGGGVDAAIHAAAGPRLLEACREIPEVRPSVRCPTGEARITPGFDLPARFVIHTVGPIWAGGRNDEPRRLASCYRNSIALAAEHNVSSLAFPAISCGIYRFPVLVATQIAVSVVSAALEEFATVQRVILTAFDDATYAALEAAGR